MRERKIKKKPWWNESVTRFQKGNGLVSFNERVSTRQTVSCFQRVQSVNRTRCLDPSREVTSYQIPDSVRVKQVLRLWRSGRRQHNTLNSEEQRTAEQNDSLSISTSLLSSSERFEDQPILSVVPGGRRTQVSPRVLRVSELQGSDWGQGYLRLSRAIETLLVRHPHRSF